MLREDVFVINQAITWVKSEPVWLCTVLKTYGSSPRSSGSLLVAKQNGLFAGSLSGGCIEEDFLQRIQNGEYLNMSQVIRYGKGGMTTNVTLPCDGSLDVLIEYLPNNPKSTDYLIQIQKALCGYQGIIKKVLLPHSSEIEIVDNNQRMTKIDYNGDKIELQIAATPKLIIAGISSVGVYCANFAVTLGFEVIICEHREEERTRFADQLPSCVEINPLFPARFLEENSCSVNTAIVSLTHDPRIDDLTLMEAMNTPAFYIGAMGSSRTSQSRQKRLINIGGLSEEDMDRIHAPIGLPIGSKTPPEIALAIMADIVACKNGLQVPDLKVR